MSARCLEGHGTYALPYARDRGISGPAEFRDQYTCFGSLTIGGFVCAAYSCPRQLCGLIVHGPCPACVFASHETDARHPFINEPRIMPGAKMAIVINPAGKNVIVHRSTPPFKPADSTVFL